MFHLSVELYEEAAGGRLQTYACDNHHLNTNLVCAKDPAGWSAFKMAAVMAVRIGGLPAQPPVTAAKPPKEWMPRDAKDRFYDKRN